MSVQQTIQTAMYQDIDALTAVIRRMQLHRGVCRTDGIALEAHIALPTSLRQYTESPSRTHYDRTLAIAKAKRANLHTDLYAMESHAVLSKHNLPMTELCASMEAITGRHFLLFGGVLAMIAVLLKFFGVDGGSGGSGGGGGGGGGGGAAKAAVAALNTKMDKLDATIDRVKTAIQAAPKPTAANPILTSYSNKSNGAQPVGDIAPNHAALVVASEAVIKHIHDMFGGVAQDVFHKVIASPDTMRAFLLSDDGPKELMALRFYTDSLVGLDSSDTWDVFMKFTDDLSDWLEKRMSIIGEYLKDVVENKKHSRQEFEALMDNLGTPDVFPESLMKPAYPSTHNAAIAAAIEAIKNAESELRIAVTPSRTIAWINANANFIRSANAKLLELWFTRHPNDAEKITNIVASEIINGITAAVGKLADNIDKLTNRNQQLTLMQEQLVVADKHLAEKHEMHTDHLSDADIAEMVGLRYINATLSFVVGMLTRCSSYLHSKTTRVNNISNYIGSFEAACVSLEKLYVIL